MKKIMIRKENIYHGNLILINPFYLLRGEVDASLLESFSKEYSDIQLQREANQVLQQILLKMGVSNRIVPVSGYRTLQDQEQIFYDSMKENGEDFTLKYVAYPNASEHQTGLAIDLGLNEGGEIDFIRPAFPHEGICNEFREYARKYGFIERYQEEKKEITHISAEEWHFRYVGYPHSEIITNHQFCLEEYTEYIKQFSLDHPLLFENYSLYYLPYTNDMEIELEDEDQISGNNIDGFIITRKLK